MADFQQPLSKKSSISNGNGSVYSEVFGGPTKNYSASRIDDYAEIFSNFYAPKPPSTIPFLDFPESDGGDFLSHSFDYSEIFGVLDRPDFAVPYDDLFSNPPPDSRTPAETDSHCQTAAVFSRVPSKEHNVDHLAHPEKNGSLSNGSSHHYDSAQQFNVSYNKANQGGKDDSLTGITHIAQLHEVSGFTYVVDACNPSQMTRSDKCLPQSTCDLDINEGSKGKAAEGNHLRQATLYAPVCTSVIKASKDDLKEGKHQLESNAPVSGQHHIQHDGDKSFPGKVFLTVSEINLLTQPSQVPPPSRPPPRLFLKRGDSERMVDSNTRGYPDEVHVFKAPTNNRAYIRRTVSEIDGHEDTAKNSSLPCFDVEVDASSAAAASVAAMKDAMEKAEAKIRSAKQSMERKRDNFSNRTKLGVNEDRKVKERREGKIAQEHKTGELNQGICDVDNNKKLDFAVDQKHKNLKAAHIGLDEGYIELAKESIGKWQRKESKVTTESHKQENETDKRNLQKHFCQPVKDDRFEVAQEVSVKANEHKLNEKHSVGIEEKEKKMARKEAFDWEENDGRLKATSKDVHEMMENKEMSNRAHEHEENEKKVNKVYEQEETELKLKVAREENEKRLKEAREREENENRIKAAQEAREREENRKRLKAAQEAHEREENEKRKAAQEAREREENEKRLKAAQKAREQEENQKRLKAAQEAHEREENEKRLKAAQEAREREENEKRLKEAQEAHEREENEKRLKAAQKAREQEENEKRLKALEAARQQEENEKRLRAAQEAREREEHEMRLKAAQEAHEREEHEKILRAAQEVHEREEHEKKLKAEQEAREREEHEKQLKAEQEANEEEENERRLKAAQAACGREENEKRLKENEKRLKESLEAHEQEENERRSKEAQEAREEEENEKRSKEAQDAHEREKHENLRASQETYEGKEDKKPSEAAQVSRGHEQEMKLRTAQEIAAHEENVKKLKTAEDAYDWQENEMKFEAAWDAYEQEENHDRPKADHEHVHEVEMKSEAAKEAQECENHRKLEATRLLEEQRNSKNILEAAQEVYVQNTFEQGENDKKLKPSQDPYEHEGNRMKLAGAKPEVNKSKLTATQRAFSEDGTVKKAAVENPHEQEENGKELKMTLETAGSEKVEKKMKAAEEVLQDGDSENLREAKKADGWEENERKTEASQSSIEPVQINQKKKLANAALDRGEHENNDREADVTLDSEEKKKSFQNGSGSLPVA